MIKLPRRFGRVPLVVLLLAQARILVGGQAVIEGVMMRVPGAYAVAVRLPLIPLVAGIGYELLKLTARFQHITLFRWLSLSWLWHQHITTQIPEDDQVTVALESLKVAFGERISEVAGRQFVADAIA